MEIDITEKKIAASIYVISCGEAINGEQIIRSALVQYPKIQMPVIKVPHVRKIEQVIDVFKNVKITSGIIVYTIVNRNLRKKIDELGVQYNIITLDIMGPIFSHLTKIIKQQPISKPGLYRQFNNVDLNRASAIEFTIAHDDGLRPHTLTQAEIVLVGVSRSGKTPLSMYLAVLGWKVANIPLVIGIPLPEELFHIDRRRIIGLTINPNQLLIHRKMRQVSLGMGIPGVSSYSSQEAIIEEMKAVRKLYKKYGFFVIDVTNKPIETSADEVIERIKRYFKIKDKRVAVGVVGSLNTEP
jgi:[pyruvate, water dikinase]-phosphate phosphotransferase / [pyruvate, water dikinase] kinase